MAENDQAMAMVDRVKEQLGFMPGTRPQPTGDLLQAAMVEVRKKREKEAEAEAEKMIAESITLTETFLRAKSEAESALKKAESEFLKKMGELQKKIETALARAQGQQPTADEQTADTAPEQAQEASPAAPEA